MQPNKFYAVGSALILLTTAIAGCNKNTTPNTPTQSVANISGDYCVPTTGCAATWQDAKYGNATAVSATLAQHGSSAGGAMNGTFGATALTAQFALTISTSNALSGTIVVNFPNSGIFANQTCTFSTTGTYTNNGSTSANISGSYTAVTNCAGDSGTYTLTQSCTDTVAVARGDRRQTFPPQC